MHIVFSNAHIFCLQCNLYTECSVLCLYLFFKKDMTFGLFPYIHMWGWMNHASYIDNQWDIFQCPQTNKKLSLLNTSGDGLDGLSMVHTHLEIELLQGIYCVSDVKDDYPTGAPGACSQFLVESEMLICCCYFVCMILVT